MRHIKLWLRRFLYLLIIAEKLMLLFDGFLIWYYTKKMEKLFIVNPFGADVFYEEVVSSTMDVARDLADKNKEHGTVIVSDFQESGRGRNNRLWQAQKGKNLCFTVLLRYSDYIEIPKALTLKSGLAVVFALEDFIKDFRVSLKEKIQIKWPNDVMIAGKKAVGILTESDGTCVFIGIGVNLLQTEFPESLQNKATSISLACKHNFMEDLRFVLLEKILSYLFQEIEKTNDLWRDFISERLYMKDKPVCFISGGADMSSAAPIEGILQGIGSEGELLLLPKGESEVKSFFTGELDVYER